MTKKWEKSEIAFAAGLVIIGLLRMISIWNLPLAAAPLAAADDGLLTRWAGTIASGQWTGTFDAYTFVKEVGFSIYLACLKVAHLPLIRATTFLYILGALFFIYALRNICSNRWVLFFVYLGLVFNPLLSSWHVGQRVYRNGFGLVLLLWAFGAIICLYFDIYEKSLKRNILWAFIGFVAVGMYFITKSDAVWILPFTGIVLLVALLTLISNRKKSKSHRGVLLRAVLLMMPLVGIVAFKGGVYAMNMATYGCNSVEYYAPVLDLLTSVEDEDNDSELIDLTVSTFKELCSLSPTLAETEEDVLDTLDEYSEYDTHPDDGEVEAGWTGWALASGFYESGVYDDPQTANEFYKNVYDELMACVEDGTLVLEESSVAADYYVDSPDHILKLVQTTFKAFREVIRHSQITATDVYVEIGTDDGVNAAIQNMDNITNGLILYQLEKGDYFIAGWILEEDGDIGERTLQAETADGSLIKSVRLYKSEDVEEVYGDTYEGADKCRFRLQLTEEDLQDSQVYLAVYDADGNLLGRTLLSNTMDYSFDQSGFLGRLDYYYEEAVFEESNAKGLTAITFCNSINDVSSSLLRIADVLGLISFAANTVLFVWRLKKKDTSMVNFWLISLGFLLSIFVLCLGIAVTELTACPAITYMYLAGAYVLMDAVCILNIGELVVEFIHGKRQS